MSTITDLKASMGIYAQQPYASSSTSSDGYSSGYSTPTKEYDSYIIYRKPTLRSRARSAKRKAQEAYGSWSFQTRQDKLVREIPIEMRSFQVDRWLGDKTVPEAARGNFVHRWQEIGEERRETWSNKLRGQSKLETITRMYNNLNPHPEKGRLPERMAPKSPISILKTTPAPAPVFPKPAKKGGILKPSPSKQCLACSVGTNLTPTGKLLLHDCDHDYIDGDAYDHYRSLTPSEAGSDDDEDDSENGRVMNVLRWLSHPSPRPIPGHAYRERIIAALNRPVSRTPSLTSLDSFATADTSLDFDEEDEDEYEDEDDLPFPEMFHSSAATSATSLSLMDDADIEAEAGQQKAEAQHKKSVKFSGVVFEPHVIILDKWKENDWYREGGFPYYICDALAVEDEDSITGFHDRQVEAFHDLLADGHRLEEYKWADEDSRRLIQAFDCHPSKRSTPIKSSRPATLRKAWRAVASLPSKLQSPRVIDSMQGIDCSYSEIHIPEYD